MRLPMTLPAFLPVPAPVRSLLRSTRLMTSPERLTVFAAGGADEVTALVKSGLLYADQVDLVSVELGIMAHLLELEFPIGESWFAPAGLFANRRPLSPQGTREVIEDTTAYEFLDLETAADAKLLRIVPINFGDIDEIDPELFASGNVPPAGILDWFELLVEGLAATDGVLFAPEYASLVEEEAPQWASEPSFLNRVSHGHLGTGLVRKLPSFPQAPMDELLDLRSDLAGPLARYRSAVRGATPSPVQRFVQRDLEDRTQTVWHEKVVPAITEIEDLYAQHGLVRELARAASQDVDKFLIYSGGLYVGLSSLSTVDDWTALALSALPRTSKTLVDALRQRHSGRKEAKESGYFYLYEVERRLRRGK